MLRKKTGSMFSHNAFIINLWGSPQSMLRAEEKIRSLLDAYKLAEGVFLVAPQSLNFTDLATMLGEIDDIRFLILGLTGQWATKGLVEGARWLKDKLNLGKVP